MPSAANVKIEIPISAENNATSDTSTNSITPLRQAITMIEHKIRNLEKRKVTQFFHLDVGEFVGKSVFAGASNYLDCVNHEIFLARQSSTKPHSKMR